MNQKILSMDRPPTDTENRLVSHLLNNRVGSPQTRGEEEEEEEETLVAHQIPEGWNLRL